MLRTGGFLIRKLAFSFVLFASVSAPLSWADTSFEIIDSWIAFARGTEGAKEARDGLAAAIRTFGSEFREYDFAVPSRQIIHITDDQISMGNKDSILVLPARYRTQREKSLKEERAWALRMAKRLYADRVFYQNINFPEGTNLLWQNYQIHKKLLQKQARLSHNILVSDLEREALERKLQQLGNQGSTSPNDAPPQQAEESEYEISGLSSWNAPQDSEEVQGIETAKINKQIGAHQTYKKKQQELLKVVLDDLKKNEEGKRYVREQGYSQVRALLLLYTDIFGDLALAIHLDNPKAVSQIFAQHLNPQMQLVSAFVDLEGNPKTHPLEASYPHNFVTAKRYLWQDVIEPLKSKAARYEALRAIMVRIRSVIWIHLQELNEIFEKNPDNLSSKNPMLHLSNTSSLSLPELNEELMVFSPTVDVQNLPCQNKIDPNDSTATQ